LAWQWLQSPDDLQIAQGATAGWVLTLCLAAMAGLYMAGTRGTWPNQVRRWWTSGVVHTSTNSLSWLALAVLCLPYLAVVVALLIGSVTGVWHFPVLWPQGFTLSAWANVQGSPGVLYNTISLGLASAAISLVWAVAWLELLPNQWDARFRPLVYLPLVLPAVLWVVGIHGLALRAGLDNRWAGVLLAHSVAVMPYTLIALSTAYQGFDVRLWHTASSLGHERWYFLLKVKWPLLRAALCAAFAVGFSVSVAQYLPTLFVGGGRISTVTTEAVTLASGGQRSLSAAFAWVQWVLPALGFGLAAWAGRPRWRIR
jgi:putative thiamine transport system permease protein